MSYRSLDELSQALMAAFRTHHPTVTRDHTDRGAELLQFLIPNPQFPAYGVSYEAEQDRGGDITGQLWFGQCELSGNLPAVDAIPALSSVLSGEIVTVIRFKNQTTFEDRHPSGQQWVFQILPDGEDGDDSDGAAFTALLARLNSPISLRDRVSGVHIGIFEIARWDEVNIIRREKK